MYRRVIIEEAMPGVPLASHDKTYKMSCKIKQIFFLTGHTVVGQKIKTKICPSRVAQYLSSNPVFFCWVS
jgi:hypothetical protein